MCVCTKEGGKGGRPTEDRYPAVVAAYMLQRNYLSIYLPSESVRLRQSRCRSDDARLVISRCAFSRAIDG